MERAARLLVAAGDPRLRGLLRHLLHDAGYAVDVAGDVPAARRVVRWSEVDLVLLAALPGVSAPDLCRELRGLLDPCRRLPLLIVGERGHLDELVAGFDAGADDYLPAPLEPRELLARVRALLRRAADHSRRSPRA